MLPGSFLKLLENEHHLTSVVLLGASARPYRLVLVNDEPPQQATPGSTASQRRPSYPTSGPPRRVSAGGNLRKGSQSVKVTLGVRRSVPIHSDLRVLSHFRWLALPRCQLAASPSEPGPPGTGTAVKVSVPGWDLTCVGDGPHLAPQNTPAGSLRGLVGGRQKVDPVQQTRASPCRCLPPEASAFQRWSPEVVPRGLFPNFFLKILFIYFWREGIRGRKRERNINVWLPLTCPSLGTWPATQACAPTGNRTSNPLVCRPALNPLSHTSQGSFPCCRFCAGQITHDFSLFFLRQNFF